jgi:type I restriction enzyme S subunit
MREWKEYKLGDIADITSSKRIFYSDYVNTGIPFYRSKEIIEKAHGKDVSTELFITPEKFYEIKEKYGAPSNGDILIAAVGERAGIPYCVENDGDFYFKDGNLIWFRNFKKEFSSKFLLHFFNSFVGQQSLESTMIGSAQKALTIIGLKNLEVKFPPIELQNQITDFLGSLDKKINLLINQNKSLNELAETLFRQWFIEEATPEEEVTLEEYVNTINGYSYKSSELNPSENALVTLKSFNRNGSFRLDGFKEFTGPVKQHQTVKQGDLIVSHTDITQEAEVIGNPALVIEDPRYKQLVITMDMVKVVPKDDRLSIPFLYFLMRTPEFKFHCLGCSNGTTVLHMSKSAIPTFSFPKPDFEKVKTFTEYAGNLLEKTFKNHAQIRSLNNFRDTILPKLMSGEATIKE